MLTNLLLFALVVSPISCVAFPNGNPSPASHKEIADLAIRAPDNRGGATPTPAPSELKGFDISEQQKPEFWTCTFQKGYRKAVIRGYMQACGIGGKIDPSFLPSYKAAKAAGYTSIDAYMFPCTGNQPQGLPPCKSPKTQVDEFIKYIKDNKISVHRLWFDIEPTSGVCNAWNLGGNANLQLAWDYVQLLKQTGYSWGIYANGNQWTGMFPSRDSNVASDLPLWAVQFDKEEGVDSVATFMGGWKKAAGKQYFLGTSIPGCGGSVDLDVFKD